MQKRRNFQQGWQRTVLATVLLLSLTSCELAQAGRAQIRVAVTADGRTHDVDVASGSTVTQALQQAGITPGELDKSEPPFYAVLNSGDAIKLTRVLEKFQTETQTVPFERQVVRNESLPVGQQRLVQAGVTGQQEVTYRSILEDGVETSRSIVKTVVLQDTTPEIVMVGAQASFAPLPIPGKIAYLAGGNAWIMDTSTANRRLLVNTGDLDGRNPCTFAGWGLPAFYAEVQEAGGPANKHPMGCEYEIRDAQPHLAQGGKRCAFRGMVPEWVEHGGVLYSGTARHGSRLASQ